MKGEAIFFKDKSNMGYLLHCFENALNNQIFKSFNSNIIIVITDDNIKKD